MTGAAGAAAPTAAGLLEPLDWVVIGAALLCLVVLVRELRRGDDEAGPGED